jgi:hypothetical protein
MSHEGDDHVVPRQAHDGAAFGFTRTRLLKSRYPYWLAVDQHRGDRSAGPARHSSATN